MISRHRLEFLQTLDSYKENNMSYTHSQGVPISGMPISGVPIGAVPSAPGLNYPVPSNAAPMYPALPVGYSCFTDKDVTVEPPQVTQCSDIHQQNARFITPYQPPPIDEQEVRGVVHRHVSSKLLYSSAAAQQMIYHNIQSQVAYLYKLATFSEKRETKWVSRPHDPCIPVDGPQNGPIPSPWDVIILPSNEFQTEKKKVKVPHSEHIQQCHKCYARGHVQCTHCSGMGFKNCISCSGSGVRFNNACSFCNSTGRDKCTWCRGQGHSECDHCRSHGHIKYHIELKAKWSVQVGFHISNGCGLKDNMLIEATGTKILIEENMRLKQISPHEFHDQGLNSASATLMNTHVNNCVGERIVKQRHSITAIPVGIVTYARKGVNGSFFVYGEQSDRKAHFDNYPSKNCCIS